MSELLPCPHCGSDRITVMNIRDGQQAVCKDCKSCGSPTFHGKDGFQATWGHAVAAWNRRASLAPAVGSPMEAEPVAWLTQRYQRGLWVETNLHLDQPTETAELVVVPLFDRPAPSSLPSIKMGEP